MMIMKRFSVLTVLATVALTVGCKDPQPKPGSLEYSQQLYDGCVQCHGENGEGNPAVGAPAIAGLTHWYVKRQLRNFQKGYRGWHAEDLAGKRMVPMAKALKTDENLDLVAGYVASMPPVNPEPVLEGGNPETGKIYFAACVQCHGANGRGVLDEFGPPLAGASDWYLLAQLQNFKAGRRGTAEGDVTGAKMRPFSMTLPNEQAMKDVIAYINSLPE